MADFPRYKIIQKPFVEPSTKLFIRQVIQTLDLLNKVVNNVNYLRKNIELNSSQIITQNSYSSVLKPILELQYLNDVEYYFFVQNIPLSLTEIPNLPFSLFSWKKYYDIENTLVKNLQGNLKPTVTTSYEKSYNAYNNIPGVQTKDYFYNLYFDVTDEVLSLNFTVWLPDLLNVEKWISVGSSNLDLKYISTTIDITVIPAELKNLIRYINLELEYLQLTDFDSTTNTTIYSYNPENLPLTRCLFSSEFPQWTGKLLLECFIPDSNENVYVRITTSITEIYQSNKIIEEEYYVFSSYTLNNIFYISIIKFIIYDGELAMKEYKININDFLLKVAPINNDLVVKGGLEVSDIIKMNTYNNMISFNSKIGINQTLNEITGYLDVDSLGTSQISGILEGFSDYENNSADAKGQIDSFDPINIITKLTALNLLDKIFVFESAIKIAITVSDINFLYVPPNSIFKTKKFSEDSFKKIQTIVNEIYRMINDGENILLYNPLYTFSFVEIINDTEYNYLCSLRASVSPDYQTMYFVSSFLLINNITTDLSYKKQFENLVKNLSSASRLVNYSQFVIRIPSIFAQLQDGLSEQSFTAYVDESTFFRFGDKTLFVQCYKLEGLNEGTGLRKWQEFIDFFYYLFAENFPPWNLRDINELYIEGTQFNIKTSVFEILEKYTKLFGFLTARVGVNNIIPYLYGYDIQLGMFNIILIENEYYLLNSYLSEEQFFNFNLYSQGNNLITGDLKVNNILNKKLFEVSSENNNINTPYRIGIGTEKPKSTIELSDTSLDDIISNINSYSAYTNNLNWNIQKINDSVDLATVVNTFTIPYTATPIVQSNNFYYFIFELGDGSIPQGKNNIVRYHYIYPDWIGQALGDIKEPNNEKIVKLAIANHNEYFKSFAFFTYSVFFKSIEWLFGRKGSFFKTFIYRGKICFIGLGINFFDKIKYNTNSNIQTLYNNFEINSILMQWIMKSIGTYTPVPPYNDVALSKSYAQVILRDDYKFTTFNYYEIKPSVNDTIKYDFNPFNGDKSNPVLVGTLPYNQYIKASNLINKLRITYNGGLTSPVFVFVGTTGILTYDDLYDDYYCLFWINYTDVPTSTIGAYVFETKILDVYKYSCTLGSDTYITGSLIVHKKEDIVKSLEISPNFVNIDPNAQFFGIGTDVRFTLDISVKPDIFGDNKYFFIVSSSKKGNAIFQRSDPTFIPNVRTNAFYGSLSSATINRSDGVYDYAELIQLAKNYGTNYGCDLSYDFTNRRGVNIQAGTVGMYLESFSVYDYKSGFKIQAGSQSRNPSIVPGFLFWYQYSLMDVSSDGKITLNNGKLIQTQTPNAGSQIDFYSDTQVGEITLSKNYDTAVTFTYYLFNKLLVPTSNLTLTITQGTNTIINNIILNTGYCKFDVVISGATVLPPRISYLIKIIQQTSNTTNVTLNNPFGYIDMFSNISSQQYVVFKLVNSYITANSFISTSTANANNIISVIANNIVAGSCNIAVYTAGDTVTAPQIRFMIMN